MVLRSLVSAALVVSLHARAQEASPPPEVKAQADWSVAAGVGVLLLSALAGQGASTAAGARQVPAASLSVERKLTERTSLMMGIAGTVFTNNTKPEVAPMTPTIETATAEQSALVALGVRRNLLSQAAPIAFSVHAILSFGYLRQTQTRTVTTPLPLGPPVVDTVTSVTNGGTVGLGAGLSVERMLIEQIALRLSLGVLQAAYSSGRQANSGVMSAAVSGFTFGLALQPALEIRVYF